MAKKALIVGINYVGTGNDLRGCINDAYNMKTLLETQGFAVEMMLEEAATTAGMKAGMQRLVAGAVPGDVLVFHYSGHGSQLPSRVEADGFEEILCPIDLNWTTKVVTDDDLRAVFNSVPNGVNTTVVLDCCHSGDGLDQTHHLSPVKDAAPVQVEGGRFLAPPADVEGVLKERALVQWSTSRDINSSAVLIAGCRSDQTSADAFINGMPQGAATAALIAAVKANPSITYQQLIVSMNDYMVRNRYTQRPQLDGSPALYDKTFLSTFVSVQPADPSDVQPAPVVTEPSKEDDNKLLIIGAIIAIVALVASLMS